MDVIAYWALLFLSLAVILFIVEIFVPSGGILGILSALALIVGVVMLFRIDTSLGMAGAIVSLIAIPIALMIAMKAWPHTPIFRLLVLSEAQARATADDNDAAVSPHADLLGREGVAATDLRPAGICVVNGRRLDALADGPMIDAGQPVKVVHVDGMTLKVRAL
jgi:membrane-bound ClpP family serine protease